MTGADLGRYARAALPIVALLVFAAFVGGVVYFAGETRGFDFLAYHQAARRVLDGQPLYDTSFEAAGGFGLFYYPPPFLPFILAFGFLQPTTAVWAWTAILVGAFGLGVAVLPVSRTTRWLIVLLAGLSWPFAYAVKLGQVGPLLFLAFAVGWRWIDQPARLGASIAIGTAIKLQPALLFVWAALTGRWRAIGVGIVVLVVLAVGATVLAGTDAWTDFLTLIGRVSDSVTTDHNFAPGAIAYQLGLPREPAVVVQWTSYIAALAAVVVGARRASAEASYLVTVCASQLLSPVLWDHYAMLLLLPVAYLVAAGRWWAVLIPLATATLVVGFTPAAAYPVLIWLTLIATLWVGVRERRQPTASTGDSAPAPAVPSPASPV